MLDVPNNADNLRLGIQDGHMDSLADGILLRKIFPREVFIDDNHWRRMFVVPIGKKSSTIQRNLHRAQVSWLRAVIEKLLHFAFVGGFGLAFEPKRKFAVAGQGWRAPARGDSYYARDVLQRVIQLAKCRSRGGSFNAERG